MPAGRAAKSRLAAKSRERDGEGSATDASPSLLPFRVARCGDRKRKHDKGPCGYGVIRNTKYTGFECTTAPRESMRAVPCFLDELLASLDRPDPFERKGQPASPPPSPR